MATWRIVALVAAALFVFVRNRSYRVLGGLSTGELISADNEERECPVFISHRFGLKGKPDALVRTNGGAVIPIERKRTSPPPHGPDHSDLCAATATTS